MLRRTVVLALLGSLVGGLPGLARADLAAVVKFDIPPQPLPSALLKFSAQSGVQVTSSAETIEGKSSPGAVGALAARAALEQLLKGTQLRFDVIDPNTIAIRALDTAGPPAAAATAESQQDGPQLEEIVVTAQKREQKLIEVPISISAFDRRTMDLQGVRDIDDVTRLTPGLANIPTSTYGGTTISIRGINSSTGAATTGIYIDDTPVQTRDYLGVVNNAYPLVFDLDRVEVLRGPQGTLFGAGSEGGTVRFITPTPSLNSTSAYSRADLGYTKGGLPNEELGVAFDTPIVADTAGIRASVWGRHLGGYIDRVSHDTGDTVATDTNGLNDLAARVTLKIAPTSQLTITPSVYYQRAGRDDLDLYWPDAGLYKSWYGINQPESDRFVLPALSINYDFSAFSVKLISSYFDRRDDRIEDYAPLSIGALTGGAESFVPGVNFHERSDTLTRQSNFDEELRFSSPADPQSRLSWVAGLFLFYGKQTYDQTEVDNIGALLPVLFPGYDVVSFYGQDQLPGHISFLENLTYKTQQKALFGEVSYRLTDRLKATAGLRVERNSFSYNDFQNGPFAGAAAFDDSGGQSETPLTPRFNLSYSVGAGQVYATAAKGYRTGGVNEQVPTTCAADLAALGLSKVPSTYSSDTVWSYELGAKQRLLDRRIELSGSVYWIDWSGIQGNIPLLDCGFGYNANLGKAVSKGFDLQIQASPLESLLMTLAVGYDDAEYTRTVYGEVNSATNLPTVLAKNADSLGVPGWQGSLSSEYAWALTAGTKAYLFGSYQYTGNYHRTGSEGVVGYNPYTYNGAPIQITNLRAGVRRYGWDVSAYVSNLFNEREYSYFYQAAAAGPDGARAETARPRTLGLTATYRY